MAGAAPFPDMKWLQVELTVSADVAAAAEQALQGLGALSVSLSDAGNHPLLEPAPGETPLWPQMTLSALLPADSEPDAVRCALAAVLGGAAPALRFSPLAERDWVREFRETLAPQRFGRLWVCPEGQPCPEPMAPRVTLEPGLAFGSGSHPTTALCLGWLGELDLSGLTILDWGCGSGILALGALALGANAATAVDIDRQALAATRENALRNGCEARLHVAEPGDVPLEPRYDVVVANILADTLIALAPGLARRSAAGARVALSGILAAQASRVRAACAPSLALEVAAEASGWVLLTGTPVREAGSSPERDDVHPLPEL